MTNRQSFRLGLAVVLFLLVGGRSHAAFFDGALLYRWCIEATTELSCMAYISGLQDGLIIGVSAPWLRNGVCFPKTLTNNQSRLVVEKYLKDHPEQLHLPAGIIVSDALTAAFPCPGGN